MIDREQLARVLDPAAWEAGYILRRESSLAAAEQLLSDPKYAVVELPPADREETSGMQVWKLGVDLVVASAFGVYIEVTRTAAYGGPVAAETALEIGAAILAASRAAQQQDTEEK